MKKLIYLVALICLVDSCKKDELSYTDEFNTSFKKWNSVKSEVSNTYAYTVSSASVFGFSSETTIYVQNGKVTSRAYVAYQLDQTSHQNKLVSNWSEGINALNTHSEGAESLTLDEIYEKAKTEWLKADRKSNDITFRTDSRGLIKDCGSTPHNCQDDCFFGIHIKAVILEFTYIQ